MNFIGWVQRFLFPKEMGLYLYESGMPGAAFPAVVCKGKNPSTIFDGPPPFNKGGFCGKNPSTASRSLSPLTRGALIKR